MPGCYKSRLKEYYNKANEKVLQESSSCNWSGQIIYVLNFSANDSNVCWDSDDIPNYLPVAYDSNCNTDNWNNF